MHLSTDCQDYWNIHIAMLILVIGKIGVIKHAINQAI